MSELGKIRTGSPRVYRDRVFGVRGKCLAISDRVSSDGLMRFVVHPSDVTDTMLEVMAENVDDIVKACDVPEADRWTVFGLRIVEPPPPLD